ncbi:hypothetical protein HDU83_001965 [Entophlyctis luteolus]|nr:hypothetical protein HDU83_001965 [Entophlyctis luteolus]
MPLEPLFQDSCLDPFLEFVQVINVPDSLLDGQVVTPEEPVDFISPWLPNDRHADGFRAQIPWYRMESPPPLERAASPASMEFENAIHREPVLGHNHDAEFCANVHSYFTSREASPLDRTASPEAMEQANPVIHGVLAVLNQEAVFSANVHNFITKGTAPEASSDAIQILSMNSMVRDLSAVHVAAHFRAAMRWVGTGALAKADGENFYFR